MNSNTFCGQNVLISGASGGIGRAIAHEFAQQGANIYLLGRDESKLAELKTKLERECSVAVETASPDLRSEEEIASFFKQFIKEVKQLDILINCAGQMPTSALMMQKLSDVKACLDTNLFSTIACCKFASRLMMRKKSGCIVNFSSIVAEQGTAHQSVYAASKAGIEGFSKSLAKELAPMNIRVNTLAPGLVDTALLAALDEEKLQERIKQVPVGRMAYPQEIAQACVFLASPKAAYMTGQVLSIDGGLQL